MAGIGMIDVGMIGVGHFGAVLVRGFLRAGIAPTRILLAPRGSEVASLARQGVAVARDNAEVVARAEAVILATRPPDAASAVADLAWRPNQLLLSVCAGISADELRRASGGAARVVRALPMTSAEFGASPTAMFPHDGEAMALLAHLGQVVTLAREADIETATAAAIAYTLCHELVGRTAQWAVDYGIEPGTARMLAASFFESAARMMAANKDTSHEALVEILATKGGVAEAAFVPLRAHGFGALWKSALDAAYARVRELGAARRRAPGATQ
ncbi:MAG: pyrroline-5-carboxylate reductase family protein [Alphaproteobacteria bacterium]